MKTSYPVLNIVVVILRIIASVEILLGVFFSNNYTSFGSGIWGYIISSVVIIIPAFITFAIAEIIKLGIDISTNTKETADHLENISNSMLERDKIIMKMMGIIVEQMKNK